MSNWPTYPLVYEINTWVWLNDLSQKTGRPVTLGNVPQIELERLAGYGFDALWLMGVWQRSPGSREIAQTHPGLQAEYHRVLPDCTPKDVIGSPYAIYDYRVGDRRQYRCWLNGMWARTGNIEFNRVCARTRVCVQHRLPQ